MIVTTWNKGQILGERVCQALNVFGQIRLHLFLAPFSSVC